MPVYTDYEMAKFSDGVLTLQMAPPQPIGQWTIRYREMVHFGGGQPYVLASGQASGLIVRNLVEKWTSSGMNNVSGINIIDSAAGILQVRVYEAEVSGRQYGSYPYMVERLDSGSATIIAEGYRLYVP